jgi:hypothetical protein
VPKALTPAAFAQTFTARFAAQVRAGAGSDGRLSTSEAAKLPEPTRDNAQNFLAATGQKSVSIEKLIGRAHDYAFATASRAAGPDGRLSAVDARSLPQDLKAEYDAAVAAPSPDARAKTMKGLAEKISLSLFGEDDSGDFVTAVRRKKPVDALTPESFCKAFGFDFAKQDASDQFSFSAMKDSTWDDLAFAQHDDAGKAAIEQVRAAMQGLPTAVVMLEDDRPFGAPVFLVARGEEGQLFGFRATVGGMGF